MFPFSSQPDLYRSHEKDLSTISTLRDQFHDFALHVSGGRSVKWQHEIDLLTQAIYHAVTKLNGKLSLGEEYCDIKPVKENIIPTQSLTPTSELPVSPPLSSNSLIPQTSEFSPPAFGVRRNHFFLSVIFPYFYHRARLSALNAADAGGNRGIFHRALIILSRSIPSIDRAWPTLERIHLALFFLTGRFLTWADRITGIRYVKTRIVEMPRPRYTALGLIIIIQLLITGMINLKHIAINQWRNIRSNPQLNETNVNSSMIGDSDEIVDDDEEESLSDEFSSVGRQCLLHLGPLRAPTALICGHVLCWRCLAECGKQKPECPLCRSPFKLEDLLRLANYG